MMYNRPICNNRSIGIIWLALCVLEYFVLIDDLAQDSSHTTTSCPNLEEAF